MSSELKTLKDIHTFNSDHDSLDEAQLKEDVRQEIIKRINSIDEDIILMIKIGDSEVAGRKMAVKMVLMGFFNLNEEDLK